MHTFALVTIMAFARIRMEAPDPAYGPHRLELASFVKALEPELASIVTADIEYTLQVYAIDRNKGVYVGVLGRSGAREVHFEIPMEMSGPREAAASMSANVRIAIKCDLAGKGLTNCQRGADADDVE